MSVRSIQGMKGDVRDVGFNNLMRLKTKLSLATVLVIVASQGACVRAYLDADTDADEVAEAVLSSSNSQHIHEFSMYDWHAERLPQNLMTYCQALVESGAPIPASLRQPNAPFHVAEFSRAYFMLLNGSARESVEIFAELTKDENHSVWGIVGLLEVAVYTRNITSMRGFLDRMRDLKERDGMLAQTFSYYALHYEFHIANYDNAQRILNEIELRAESLLMQVHLLVRENRFGDAQRHIDLMAKLPELQGRAFIIMAQAEILAVQYGYEKSTKFLNRMSAKFPEMWQLRLLYAIHLTGLERQGPREIAAQTLLSLVDTRKHDIAMRLIVINVLLDLRAYDKAGMLINGLPRALNEFYYYNLVLAKLDSLMGDLNSRHANLSKARAMFPMEPDGLWFAYRISALNGDYQGAITVLNTLLSVDPHDQYVLASLAQSYVAIEQWQEAQAIATSVLQSNRYLDVKLRNEMRELRSRAAATSPPP